MRPQKPFPVGTVKYMEELLEISHIEEERRRIKTVYLRAKHGYCAEKISVMVGLKLQTVRNIHSAFFKYGENALLSYVKGGRRNYYLEYEDEIALISEFQEERFGVVCVEVSEIDEAYQEKVGVDTALSTTYRLLHRHGWQKLPHHPGFCYRPQKKGKPVR